MPAPSNTSLERSETACVGAPSAREPFRALVALPVASRGHSAQPLDPTTRWRGPAACACEMAAIGQQRPVTIKLRLSESGHFP
jgi:hypothetical protein